MRTGNHAETVSRGRAGGRTLLLWIVLAVTLAGAGCQTEVPGVVVDLEPSPSYLELILDQDSYIGSPSIAILPNGDYAASHDIFGGGSTEATSGITEIFRSTDRGASWIQTTTLSDQFWSTLFVHGGALYIFGYTCSGEGDLILRRSDDGGFTWTTPDGPETGLLREGNYGGTPNRPVVYDGRLWIGQSTRLMSAPVEADLLRSDSWTLSNGVPTSTDWLDGRFEFWSEGQVTASPAQGVVLMPKVKGLPYTALLRADSPGTLTFDADDGFVELPGAEKKFGAAYDAVSEKYYVLDNPVLPAHKDDLFLLGKPEMIRNTAAVLSSSDLRSWEVEAIFLYSPHIHYEAFQYLNFELDGDDLAVISRTAFFVGGYHPPRGHDSNLMTFHRIPDFRTLTPRHVLEADTAGCRVLRFEETQHERAPLGDFPLGLNFADAPLDGPAELAQDADGNVYVGELSGRILEFDAAGNFLGPVPEAPVPFQGGRIPVRQPDPGEKTWIGEDSSAWEAHANWYYWGRPDREEETAVFGSAAAFETTVTLDRPLQLRGLRFRNEVPYTLDGSGELVIGSDGSEPGGELHVTLGEHAVRLPVTLGGPAEVRVGAGASLTLAGRLDLDGETIGSSGPGLLSLEGDLVMGGGRLVVTAERPVVLGGGAPLSLDGTLELRLPEGAEPAAGDAFDLIDFTPPLGDTFEAVALPDLPAGLVWETTDLYETGAVRVVLDGR